MVKHEEDSKKLSTLHEWFVSVAKGPILIATITLVIIQILLATFQNLQAQRRIEDSAENLASVFSLAIFQSNRILIEKVSALALTELGAREVTICSRSKVVFSSSITEKEQCTFENIGWLDRIVSIPMASAPNFQLFFVFPKFPRLWESVLVVGVFAILFLPVYIILAVLRRRVESDIVHPLAENVGKILISDDESTMQVYPFKIREFETLFAAYLEKTVSIKKLVEAKLLAEKEAAIGRITSQVSHDLRGPLGVFEKILITADDQLPLLKEPVKLSLYRIYSMIDALRSGEADNLINRSYERISLEEGKHFLSAKAENSQVSVTFVNTNLPAVSIDHVKVERAWINLASNGIEFAKTFVRVEVDIDRSDLIIRVTDDGPGISESFISKLFQRGATHGKHDGTGLGLAYVRQIMRGHGGDVTYRRENSLTVFECHLPNAVETEREEEVENTAVLDVRLVQKVVRLVAICLEPELLSKSVLAQMASYKADEFLFSGDRQDAHIVVSNIDDIMFKVLEGDEQEFIHVTPTWGNEEAIVAKLKLKFNLD